LGKVQKNQKIRGEEDGYGVMAGEPDQQALFRLSESVLVEKGGEETSQEGICFRFGSGHHPS
jgi:hypothetical protein